MWTCARALWSLCGWRVNTSEHRSLANPFPPFPAPQVQTPLIFSASFQPCWSDPIILQSFSACTVHLQGGKNTVFLLRAFRKADPRTLEKMQSYISTWATLPGPFFIDFFIISPRPYHRTHSIRELDGAGWCSPSKEIRKSTLRNQKRNSRGLRGLVAGVWWHYRVGKTKAWLKIHKPPRKVQSALWIK